MGSVTEFVVLIDQRQGRQRFGEDDGLAKIWSAASRKIEVKVAPCVHRSLIPMILTTMAVSLLIGVVGPLPL